MSGMRMTCFGSAIAQMMSVKMSLRPTKRFFASAYPASAEVAQVRSIAATAIHTVLSIQRIAPGTVGPAENTIGLPSEEKYWLKGM